MKRLLLGLYASLCLFSALGALANERSAEWSVKFDGSVQWQEIGPFGDFLVGCTDGLYGIDPVSGEIAWVIREFAGIQQNAISPLPSSFFYRIEKDERTFILDPHNGKLLFDSFEAGMIQAASAEVLYETGGILVLGKTGERRGGKLAFVEMDSGKLRWSLEDDFGRMLSVEELDDDHLLLVCLFDMYKIDSQEGAVIWKRPTTPEARMLTGTMGNLLKALTESVSTQMDIGIEFSRDPKKSSFYISSGDDENGTATYLAYDLKTGERKWSKEFQAYPGSLLNTERGAVSLPRPTRSGTLIFGRYKVNLHDPETGEGQWGKKGNGVALKGGVDNAFAIGETLFLSTISGKGSLLYSIDMEAGEPHFKKPFKMNGRLLALYETDSGYLCLGDEETNLYDPSKGAFVLRKSLSSQPFLTDRRGDEIYVYDVNTREISSIHMRSGKTLTVGKMNTKFIGKEIPTRLQAREEGILLFSNQNAAMMSYQGEMNFTRYVAPPRENKIMRVLYLAQAMRASVFAARAYYVTGSIMGASLSPEYKDASPVAQTILGGIAEGYGVAGQRASEIASESFKKANRRFQATSESDAFILMLGKKDRGAELVKVSKADGEIRERLDLGKDKDPNYSLDAFTNRIFLREDVNMITAYQM